MFVCTACRRFTAERVRWEAEKAGREGAHGEGGGTDGGRERGGTRTRTSGEWILYAPGWTGLRRGPMKAV